MFGFLGLIFGRLGALASGSDPHPGSNILLRDASSNLLLRNGADALLRGH